MSIVKIIIIVLLIAIVISMASSLFYLVKDKSGGKRVVKALTLRIALSITAFIVLMVAYAAGLVSPNM